MPRFAEVLEHIDIEVPLRWEVNNDTILYRLRPGVADSRTEFDGEFSVGSFNPISVLFVWRHHPPLVAGS